MLLSFPYYLQLVEKKFAIFISHKENCKWNSLASLFILNMTILIIFLVHSIVYLFHLFLWIKNAITTHRCMNERVINKLIFWTFFSLILWNVNCNYLWCFWRYFVGWFNTIFDRRFLVVEKNARPFHFIPFFTTVLHFNLWF